MSSVLTDKQFSHHVEQAKMLLHSIIDADWAMDEAFFAISFAYVLLCKTSGMTDEEMVNRIEQIASAMKVSLPTEQ